jgi:hypothetical protein
LSHREHRDCSEPVEEDTELVLSLCDLGVLCDSILAKRFPATLLGSTLAELRACPTSDRYHSALVPLRPERIAQPGQGEPHRDSR